MTNVTIFQLADAALPLDPGALVEVDLPGAPRTSAKTPLKAVALAAASSVLGSIGVYGIDSTTTAGLTWGYVGGLFNGNTVAAGSVALTDGATNFVVVLRSTGAVSVSTTSTNSLSPLYAKLFKVTALGSNVTAVVDQRLDTNGLLLSAGAGPIAPDTDGTLAANSDAIVSSQKAVKTYVDAHVTPPVVPATDGTFAANSDALVPSQKAVKTYVDAHVAPPIAVDTDGTLAANSNAVVPSQKAIKSYVDNQTVAKSTDGTFAANSDLYVPSQKAVKSYVASVALGGALDTDPTLAANSDARAASQKATKSYVDTRVSGIVGGMVYAGAWNASTNTPALVSAVGTKGNYYTVSVAGTTALDGHAIWNVGDKAAFNGIAWEKFDGTDSEVLSVAGRTGAVVLSTGDVAGLGTAAAAAIDTDVTLAAASDTRVPSQAAVVAYVQGLINSRAWKNPARAGTTAALPANTYANGLSGVGATLTANANGALPAQDGVTPIAGDSLLVKNEAAGASNGLYVVTQLGDATRPYILTRRVDDDAAAETLNATCEVSEGTTQADQIWQCTTNAPIVVGTTALVWAVTGAGGGYTSPTTTKGDLIVRGSSADSRHGVGVDGQVLTADSTQADGVKWSSPAASGAVRKLRSVFVDVSYGNDSTGAVDDATKPFATINAAFTAAGNQYTTAFCSSGRHAPIQGDLTPASPSTLNPSSVLGNYLSILGSGRPLMDSDTAPTTLDANSGTVIDGQFTWHSTRQGIRIENCGFDAGSAVCTARYSGSVNVQGLGTFNVGQVGSLAPSRDCVVRNVVVLTKSNGTGHATIFENALRPVVDNVVSVGSVHAFAVKAVAGRFSNIEARGASGDAFIIKESNTNNDSAPCHDNVFTNLIAADSPVGLWLETASSRPLERLQFANFLMRNIGTSELRIFASGSAPGLVQNCRIENLQTDNGAVRTNLASYDAASIYINGISLAGGGAPVIPSGIGNANNTVAFIGTGSGDLSTTSTTFVALPGYSISLPASIGDVIDVELNSCYYGNTASQQITFQILANGVDIGQELVFMPTASTTLTPLALKIRRTVQVGDLVSGAMPLTVKFKTSAGTAAFVNTSPYHNNLIATNNGNGFGGLRVLSQTTGFDAKTVSATALFTVPVGKKCVVTGAIVECTAATAITAPAALGIGVAAGESDLFGSITLAGLLAAGQIWSFVTSGLSIRPNAGDVIKLGIDTGAIGTSQTISVTLLGYLE